MRRGWIEKARKANWRTWVAVLALVVIVLLARPTWRTFFIGLPLVALGEAIRVWGAGYLVKTKDLIVSGPYAYVQHPLYLGSLFIMVGLVLMGGYPWWVLLIALVAYFGYYMPRKHRIESHRLGEIYGEPYRRYEAAVPRLFPYRGAYRPEDARAHEWSWGRLTENSEDGAFWCLVIAVLLVAGKVLWL